jgi:hypothetical protein
MFTLYSHPNLCWTMIGLNVVKAAVENLSAELNIEVANSHFRPQGT